MSPDRPPDATPDPGAADPSTPANTVVARPGSHRAHRSPLAVVLPGVVVALAMVAVGVGVYGWLTALDGTQELAEVSPFAEHGELRFRRLRRVSVKGYRHLEPWVVRRRRPRGGAAGGLGNGAEE